jgi:SAM-dependent methyltransferase
VSFTPLMIKLVVSLRDSLPGEPTVVELGNQTFDPTISGTLTRQGDLILPLVLSHLGRSAKPYDIAAIKQLAAMSVEQQKPCTAAFFKALGFASYDAIDVNSLYGSLVMDLNADLRERYGFERTFDLVTNNGTGEHIFNQYSVFRNMHQLTKVGGVMLFVLPFHNWMNHGFFNFNPILFGDLATANGYRILRLSVGLPEGAETGVGRDGAPTDEISLEWQPRTLNVALHELQQRGSVKPFSARVGIWWLAKKLLGQNPLQQASRLPVMVTGLAERSANVNVVAALQKTRDSEFAAPLQGMYAGTNVESAELRAAYKTG